MIKNLIKKTILKQCEVFGITPKEAIQIDAAAIIVAITIALSVRPFFGLVELLIKL